MHVPTEMGVFGRQDGLIVGALYVPLVPGCRGALLVSSVPDGGLDAMNISRCIFSIATGVRASLGVRMCEQSANTGGRIPSPFTGFALDDDVLSRNVQ